MIKGLWSHAIKVNNIQEAVDFYTRHMGGELRFTQEINRSQLAFVRVGASRVALFDKAPYENDLDLELPPGLLHVVYEVDDLDFEAERLRQAGIKFFVEPCVVEGKFGVQKIAIFEKPDGVRTEIMQILKDSGRK